METISKSKIMEWCKGMCTAPEVITRSDWMQGFDRAMSKAYEEIESGRFDSPEPTGPYTIRRDPFGYAEAIERDGYTLLHLNTGTERNEEEVEGIVDRLNGMPGPSKSSMGLMLDKGLERVREAIEAIEDEMCDDFSPRAQRINEQLINLREALDINIPDQDEAALCREQIAAERADIAKYGFGGDGGINYPDDGTNYPKEDTNE